MEIYIAAAIAFAIMYHFRYIREINEVVKLVATIHDAESNFSPNMFSVVSFISTILAMPWFAYNMLTNTRKAVIKNTASGILVKYFDLELKK